MAAPLNTCALIEQCGIVRLLWAKNKEAKDIHKEMLPNGQHFFVDILCCIHIFLPTKNAQRHAVLSWSMYSGAPPSFNSCYVCTVMRIPFAVRQ
jgi:hypothetical protein